MLKATLIEFIKIGWKDVRPTLIGIASIVTFNYWLIPILWELSLKNQLAANDVVARCATATFLWILVHLILIAGGRLLYLFHKKTILPTWQQAKKNVRSRG